VYVTFMFDRIYMCSRKRRENFDDGKVCLSANVRRYMFVTKSVEKIISLNIYSARVCVLCISVLK